LTFGTGAAARRVPNYFLKKVLAKSKVLI